MDKGGEDTSRFSTQIQLTGHKRILLFSALDRSKKERIRRLSTVNNRETQNHEEQKQLKKKRKKKKKKKSKMGRHVSSSREVKQKLEEEEEEEGEELLPSSICNSNGTGKRLKLPRKRLLEFDDSNGVYCSSVPRKLRTAMKKRGRESPSFPNSKKLNCISDGVESPIRDVLNKPEIEMKQGISDWSPRHSISGPITKDEEEVAEALYALAGMFPDNLCNHKRKLDDPSLNASLSASLEMEVVPPAALKGIHVKEEMTTGCVSRHDKASQPEYNAEKSLEVTATVRSLNDRELPSLPDNKQFNGESDSCVAQLNLETSQPKTEEHSPLFNSYSFFIQPKLHHDRGTLKQPAKLEVSLFDGKPDVNLGLITATKKQLDQLHASNESEKNALWPGLTSGASSCAWSHGSSARSFAAELPPWLDTALCAMKPVSFQNGSSIEEIAKDDHRTSWKRCATHLHVSRLIQKLQITKSQDNLPLHPDQARPDRISNQAVLLTMNINEVKSGLNATRSNGVGPNAFENHANDARGVFQKKILQQQKPTALSSGAYSCQKQCFNFLSLSTGDSGLEASEGMKAMKNGLEISKKSQFPPFCSHGLNSVTTKSISMPQGYPSSPFLNQPPAAASPWQVQIQQPAYSGSLSHGPQANPNSLSKQCHKQLLHQEQRQVLWATQLAARYRNTGLSMPMSMNQYRASANARLDLPMLTLCTETDVPSSSLPIEVLNSKNHQIPEHQQHVMTINSSLPHARMKWRDHHLSSSYDENGGGFEAGSALPLQLLCNERL